MRILVVDDDEETRELVGHALQREGYGVVLAPGLESAQKAIDDARFDVVVLDVMLGQQSGLDLCTQLRRGGMETPILFLSARGTVRARVEGLDAGGDDYLAKPFALRELLARVRALGRRGPVLRPRLLQLGALALDFNGRRATAQLCEVRDFLGFFGEMSLALWRALLLPHRFRWTPFLANIQSAGLAAMPIVGLLSFLLGVVIAYQGGSQLGRYGANIFIVELVSLTMLREMSVIMTAIIVAGRTGSAWTAQIGTMRVTEEIDALRTIGIRPMDMLVIPKVFALMVALPLLTVYADAMGVLGGMVMADLQLGVSFQEFLQRFPQAVSVRSFLIGVGKAPVFALLIALVGCYQGFKVSGGAEAVGRQTTVSVVQSIFLVIVVDAAFSVLFSWLKI